LYLGVLEGNISPFDVVHSEPPFGMHSAPVHPLPLRSRGVQCDGLAKTPLAFTRTQQLSATTIASHPPSQRTPAPFDEIRGTLSSTLKSSAPAPPAASSAAHHGIVACIGGSARPM
jgi:hypothetical protein